LGALLSTVVLACHHGRVTLCRSLLLVDFIVSQCEVLVIVAAPTFL
jgi:hypothetical protein